MVFHFKSIPDIASGPQPLQNYFPLNRCNGPIGLLGLMLVIVLTTPLCGLAAANAQSSAPAQKKRAEPTPKPSSEAAQTGAWAQTLTRRSKEPSVDPRVFDGANWTPPPPAAVRAAEGPPAVPPFPYTYAGRLTDGGLTRIFLTQGDAIVTAVQGDVLDGQFRLDAIDTAEIKVTYVPMKKQLVLPLESLGRQPAEAPRTVAAGPGSPAERSPSSAPQGSGSGAAASATPATKAASGSAGRAQAPGTSAPTARAGTGAPSAAGAPPATFPMLPAPSGTLAPAEPRDPFVSSPAQSRPPAAAGRAEPEKR
jgi:hypothetical protein